MDPSAQASSNASTTSEVSATEEFAPPPTTTLTIDPNAALLLLQGALDALQGENVLTNFPALSGTDLNTVVAAYDHMTATLMQPRYATKYGGRAGEPGTTPIPFCANVPSYYANVTESSIFSRKLLSIAGLRNLLYYGPIIYGQLRERAFSGNVEDYKSDEGMALMRAKTGNVVDLDTVVLRCSDPPTFKAINCMRVKANDPPFSSIDALSKSTMAEEIAINGALPLLEAAVEIFDLSTVEARVARRVDLSQIQRPIPMATSNTDRGKFPIWHYRNCGVDSFHANVPTMDDVNGALLRSPFRCIELWLRLHATYSGEELERRCDVFFDNCVAESCFNMKWKAIESYGASVEHEGTIVDVLQRTQAAHQSIFTAEFFAGDDSEAREIDELWKLVQNRVGREAASGRTRPLTREDVRVWVLNPAVTI